MSEHEIERYAEKQMDKIDRRLMDGRITADEYDYLVREIDLYCQFWYAKLSQKN